MIVENPCKVYRKKLEIGLGFYNYETKKKENLFLNPKDIDEIILTRSRSSISTDVFQLKPDLSMTIFNRGKPTHLIIPINNLPKILKNEKLFDKLSKYKKRKLAWIFCKAVCSERIKQLKLLNQKRGNIDYINEILNKMRELDRKLIKCKTRNEMMGLEGNIAKLFYHGLAELNPLFDIIRKREGADIVNVSMNLCHTILRNKVKIKLIENGLNISRGFLHYREERNEDYLVWDFSEFWIPYVDKLIFYALERKIISKDDVSEEGILKKKPKDKMIKLINERVTNEKIDNKIKEFVGFLKGDCKFSFKKS